MLVVSPSRLPLRLGELVLKSLFIKVVKSTRIVFDGEPKTQPLGITTKRSLYAIVFFCQYTDRIISWADNSFIW